MPKSYKICPSQRFDHSAFSYKPLVVGRQINMEGVPPVPQTVIYRSRDSVQSLGFTKYSIEHEMEENTIGRANGTTFQKFIRKGFIDGYHSNSHNLLLLSGKKRDILDFCKKSKQISQIQIRTIHVEMKALLTKLPHVKLVWFKFPNGLIRASALMGANVEATADFQKYRDTGDISTLSFHYEYDGLKHPVMITEDGAIVLQGTYREISTEIGLVLDIKQELLDGIFEQIRV